MAIMALVKCVNKTGVIIHAGFEDANEDAIP